jgi:hypothetical protein
VSETCNCSLDNKHKVAFNGGLLINYLIFLAQVDVLYHVIPQDKVTHVAIHVKTFVVLLIDDSTAQDPSN